MAVIRRLLRTLLVLALVVLAFAAGAIAVLTLTDRGRENLAGLVSRLASTADSKVTVSGITGIWSGVLRVDRLVLEDAEGPWLAARDVAIDWSPLALLGSTFDADRVSAFRVEVARLPEPGKDKVPEGQPFTLPVDIAVRSIDLPDIALGQALTGGQIASVAATGKVLALADPLTVDADLTVTRSDGVAGSVVAAIGFAPSANRLEIDLKASEPSGGILANLLRLPGKPAVDIIVSGNGPASNWRGTGTFAVDGALIASVSSTHRLTDAGSEIEAKGDGDFASFVPDRFKRVLEGRTSFDIAGTATKSGGFVVKRADIGGTAVTATAAGQFDPEGATDFSFEIRAREGGLPLSFGTEESPIDITVASATVRALGDGRAPGLDIAADLPSVSTNDVKLNSLGITLHSDGFDLSSRIGPFTGGATAQSLVIDNPTIEPLVAGEIRAGLEGTLEPDTLTVASGSLRSDAIDGSFGGKVSLADGSITLDLKAGVLSAALPEAVRPLLGENVALATSLERDSEGNVSANALSVVSGGLSASGSAKLSGGQIDAKLDGALADIAPAVPGGSGSVKLSATASGSFVSPDVSATLTSDRIGFRGRAVDNLDLTVKGRMASATPDVDAALKGTFEGQALDAKATLATSGGRKQVRDLSFALGPNRITGTLALDDAFLPDGTLQFDLADLGPLAALAGQTVQGSARGTASFGKADGVPQVSLSLTSPSIARDKLAATAVTVDALVKYYLADTSISGRVGATVADLVPEQPPVTVDVALEGTPADIAAQGTLSMEGAQLSAFTASHRLTEAGSIAAVRGDAALERLLPPNLQSLVAGGAAFDVAATIGRSGLIAIDRATAATAALNLSAAGSVDPANAIDVTVNLAPGASAAPLAFGPPDNPVEVTIGLATLRASGPTARPVLDLSASLPSVAAPGARLSDAALTLHSDGFDTATRSGQLTGSAVIASVALDNPTAAPLVAGEVRAAFSAELTSEVLTVRSGSLASAAVDGGFDGTVSLGDGAFAFNLRTDVASAALPPAARPALGETVQIAAAVARDAQGAISVNSATVASGALSASGSARIAGEVLEAQIKGVLADIAPLAGQASGAVAFSATAGGTLAVPDVSATLTSDRIGFNGRALEAVDLSVKGKIDGASPDIAAALKGRFEGQALDAQATLVTAGGQKALRDLSLALGANRIAGALALDDAFLPEGTVQFDLADLASLAALAGQAVQGSAQGTATFTKPDGVPQVELSLSSPSIARDRLVATSVTVDALVKSYLADPAVSGTVAATVADLIPGQPAVTIEAALQGTPADLTGEGTLSIEGTTLTTFTAAHRLTDAGSVVSAKGDAILDRFLPEQLRSLVAGGTAYDVAATLAKDGVVTIDHATATTAALSAAAAGTVDPANGLDLTLDVAPGTAAAPLSLGTAASPLDIVIGEARLRAGGPVARPALDLAARLASVTAPGVRLSDVTLAARSDGFDTQARSGPVSGSAVVASIALDNATLAPLVAGEVRAAFEAMLSPETLTVQSGSLASEAIDGSFDGTVSLGDGALAFNLRTDVASAALPAAARPVLGETVQLAAAVARDAQGAVSVSSATVAAGPLSASGSARLAGGQIDAKLEGALADIAPLAGQASGAVAFSATAGGVLAAPDVSATVTSERIGIRDRALEGLDLSVKGRIDSASPDIAATLKARFEGQALDARATLVTAGGQKALRDLSFALGANRITGTLALDAAFLPDGTVRFELPDLASLAALAGQEVQGSAQGTATFANADGVPQVDLTLSSASLAGGGVTATSVTVDALVGSYLDDPSISGRVGATVADLIPNQPPVTIEAALQGTPADIVGEGTLSMAGAPLATFSASHRLTEEGSVVSAKGNAALDRFLPEKLRSLVAGGTAYDVAATIAKGGAISIDRATAATPALQVSAAGTVDPAEGLGLTLDLAPGTAATPLSLGTAESPLDIIIGQARLHATGPVARPALDLTAHLASVVAKGARLSDIALTARSDGFDTQARSGPLSGSAVVASVALDNAVLAPLVAGEVRAAFAASLTSEVLTIQSGSLRSDAIDGSFDGTVSLGDGAVAFNLRTDVASAALPAAARPVLGETVRLAGAVARDAEGAMTANAVTVVSGPLSASGSARLAGETLEAQVKGSLGDIAPLAAQASGAIGFSATARGALAAPDLDVTVSSERLLVAERAIENLILRATAKADFDNPSANVTLKGSVGGEALDGKAVLETSNGNRAVRDLSLSLGANRIAGALSLDPAFVPEGTVDLAIPDIGPLAALALETVEGSLNGRIVFERGPSEPRIAVRATSKSIVRGDLSVSDVAIDASVSNYLAAPGVAGKIRAKQLRSGTTVVSGVDVDLARDGSWTTFSGGATVSGIPLRAAGRVESGGGITTVELASAQAVVQGVTAKLARTTKVRIENGSTRLDRLTLSLGSGTATVSGTAGPTLSLDVVLAGLPASLANQFAAGLDASGPISGTVKVTGSASDPTVGYQLDWTGAQTAQTRAAGIGALTVRSSGTYAGNRLTFDATAGNAAGLSFNGGGSVALAGTPQLDIRLTGAVPLGVLAGQLAAQGISLSGTADVDLTIRGPATAPTITGSVRAGGARLVYVDAGIALDDIAADIAIASDRATINRLTGSISSGGTVSASGSVGIGAGSGFPADIAIRVADGRYTDGRVVTTTVAAELAIRGPLLTAPTLTGTVNLGRTVISIPERLPASLTALDVKHRNAPPAVRRQAELLRPAGTGGSKGGGLSLDVTVNAPQRIFVQGRGLDAELGGSLRLVGPVSAPRATGGFDLRRGRLLLLGRRLTFTEGSISFNGSLVPDLNFQATSEAADATVTVIVSGPANNPKFSFTSTPALPEDEVLAQLIFGRAMSNLSAVQLAQLADAAAQLAGAGGSTSLLTSLREKLGVDNIDVTTGETGGATVTVGKYLNDRTYLSIESGDKAGSGRAAIDLDVGRGVKLRGEARDDGQAKGGIFFEREY